MSRADEEWIRQTFEQRNRHTNLAIPAIRSDYAVDIEGQVYKRRPAAGGGGGGWFPTGRTEYAAAAEFRKGRPVYLEKAVTGQPLYEDPSLVRPITLIDRLPQPVLPKPPGLGAMGVLGILGFLAIIGVVIWIIVARHESGYPPSRTFADSYDTSGARKVSAIAFSPNGKELVAADAYSGANLWNVNSGRLVYDFNPDTVATRAAFSPNGKLLAVGDYYGNVFLWNIARKRQVAKFTDPMANGFSSPYSGGVYGLAFNPDGKILAAAEYDGKVHLWNVHSRSKLATLHVSSNDSGGLVGYMAFSPNGHILAVGDSNGKTYLWNVARKSRVAILSYPHSSTTGIAGVAFSPNGHTLATLETDGTAVLWNVSTRNEVSTLPVGDSGFDNCSIAFSPSGKTLAAGCNGSSTYLWDVASKQQVATLTGPSGYIDGVAFSPDGKTLAAGSDAGYIYLWDVGKLGSNK
jgi:WD40 repeat protein